MSADEGWLVDVPASEATRLEEHAGSLYLDLRYREAARAYERVYGIYRSAGEPLAAARAARMIAWITGNVLGEWAVHGGWLARAATALEEAGDDDRARGWLLVIRSHGEWGDERQRMLRDAVALGRRVHDPDLEFEALSFLAIDMVMTGRPEEGLALFDEAMTATCAGELEELGTVDSMFCGFFWACELVHDVVRADQWMRAAERLVAERKVVAAFCRAHYGGILTAAGRWEEAEVELVEAVRHFDEGLPERRVAGLVRLAGLRVRQGRTDEAAQLLKGFEEHPDAVETVAAMHLANGDLVLAREALERAVEASPGDGAGGDAVWIGPLAAQLVDVYLAQEDLASASAMSERLARIAQVHDSSYLRAATALAKGRLCAARGDQDARACLYEALVGFAEAQVPLELGRAHLAMAAALATSAPEVAVNEARQALEIFERLSSARYADEAAALLRSLGVASRTGIRRDGPLTRREQEVLDLVGAGLSNPEIAERLFISRKTVEHHVGNVLAKLGLRNRAEAAGYAVRQKTSP